MTQTLLKSHALKNQRSVSRANAEFQNVFEVENNVAKFSSVLKSHDFIKCNMDYLRMMRYMRPSGDNEEKAYSEFLGRFIEPVFGKPDERGNYVLIVPKGSADAHGKLRKPTKDTMPDIAFMSHHDTVHRDCGWQSNRLVVFEEIISTDTSSDDNKMANLILGIKNPTVPTEEFEYTTSKWCNKQKKMIPTKSIGRRPIPNHKAESSSSCLGADCTTGVFIMLEMIKALVPGIYVVHADEEIGCKGSEFIVASYTDSVTEWYKSHYKGDNKTDDADIYEMQIEFGKLPLNQQCKFAPVGWWINHTDFAISFDRFGYNSIITHQSSTRTASDDFAKSLAGLLDEHMLNASYYPFFPDNGGSFTDSNKYRKLISECTNLSVGYLNQHTQNETQDLCYLNYLIGALVSESNRLNGEHLVASRDPSYQPPVQSYRGSYNNYHNYYGYGQSENAYTFGADNNDDAWAAAFGCNNYGDDDEEHIEFYTIDGKVVAYNSLTGETIEEPEMSRDLFTSDPFADVFDEMTEYQKNAYVEFIEIVESHPEAVAEYLARKGSSTNELINFIIATEK